MRLRRFGASVVLAGALVAVVGSSTVYAASPNLFARATGNQEAPGPGDANGFGAAMIDTRAGAGQVCIGVRYRGLDPRTAMHIHSGAMGVGGPIVVDLTPALTGTRCVSADKPLVRDIRDNPRQYYLNIHTSAFVNGATRGQLEPSLVPSPFGVVHGPMFKFARMSGAQETPSPGDPNGTGVPFVDLKPGTGQVCTDVRYRNIDPAQLMHIHSGAAGVAGPIVVDLTQVLSGTRCVNADPALIRDIRDRPSLYYCNVHTGDFPNGAVRGQLETSQ